MKKVFMFGIDGASPELIFDKWLEELPTIKYLMERGCYARLNSSIPPSTILSWTSMLSGKDPSEFDVFSYTYLDEKGNKQLTSSNNLKVERIWEIISKEDKKSIVLNVPLTYPIREFSGFGTGGFLTPNLSEKSAYPKELLEIIKGTFPNYCFDVSVGLASYKNLGKEEMIKKIYEMTEVQIEVLKFLLQNKEWDFAMWVCIGTDRLQHTMWSYIDENHIKFKGETEFKNTIKDYYKYLDKKLSEILEIIGEEVTTILVSDHGFNKMDGRVNLNDWFRKEGYLVLKKELEAPEKFDSKNVDWSKTKAHAVGAYFGRVFFNKKSRGPEGILDEVEVAGLQEEIIGKLKYFEKPDKEKMDMKFFKPQDIYKGQYIENSPDLYIYFDNLIWGINNDVGNKGLFSETTLIGSDDGGHAPQGIFLMSGKEVESKGELEEVGVLDIMPTALSKLGLQKEEFRGRKIK